MTKPKLRKQSEKNKQLNHWGYGEYFSQSDVSSTSSTLTLKKLEKLYKQAKVYNDDYLKQSIYPAWKYWFYKLMFWKYKEVMKGVFLVK